MRIHKSLINLPSFRPPVHLALGVFDGVHQGHQKIIGEAMRLAHDADGTAAVLTFTPHPGRVLTPAAPAQLIQSLEDRAARIAALGVDELIAHPFTSEFSRIPATGFLRLLRESFRATSQTPLCLHAGENFRFGHGGAGNFLCPNTFYEHEENAGVQWKVTPGVEVDGDRVSSTRIRELLAVGEVTRANTLLGWNYESHGHTIAGRALGRTLGFPTLNMPWVPELLPRFGVYAVRLHSPSTGCGALNGIANYGLRPTVERGPVFPLLEVHLLGESGNAAATHLGPGSALRVEWLNFLRAEQKFPSLDALLTQIRLDAQIACSLFGIATKFPA